MPDYETLRNAVLAYDRALRAYGVLGQPWQEHSDKLDRLWFAVLDAAEIEHPPLAPEGLPE